jgi:hypothetical protein
MNVSQGPVCQAASKHLNERISRRIVADLRYAASDDGKPPDRPISEKFWTHGDYLHAHEDCPVPHLSSSIVLRI